MSGYKYKAFISYSHQDKRWARWLHRRLEGYRPPREVGVEGKHSLKPIFRDTDELAAARDLTETIRQAIADSEHLIVICSPSAATSRWVEAEIDHFIALGRGASIHCVIVAGAPGDPAQECLPPPLRQREPLAADVRSTGDGRRIALVKLAAALLGVPLDALRRRDLRRRQRRMAIASTASFAGMVGASTLAFIALQARDAAQAEAEKSRQITAYLVDVFKRTDPAETRKGNMTARDLLEESILEIPTRFETQKDVLIELSNEVGSIFESYAEFDRARDLYEQAAEQSAREYGTESLEYARSIRGVARMLLMQDQYEDSLRLARQGLAIEERLLGSESPELAGGLSDLAGSLVYSGDFGQEPTELLERAERLHRLSGKADNSDAIATEFRLADLYRQQGRYDEAIARYESTLRRLEGIDARPDRRAMVLTELGNALEMSDRTEEGLASYDEAIAILSDLYGADHANLANVWLFKAHLLISTRDSVRARDAVENAIRIARNALGPDSDLVSYGLEAKVRLLLIEGSSSEAMALADEVVQRWKERLGAEHLDTASSMVIQAEAMLAGQHLASAVETAERAAASLLRYLPDEHPRVQRAHAVRDEARNAMAAGKAEDRQRSAGSQSGSANATR